MFWAHSGNLTFLSSFLKLPPFFISSSCAISHFFEGPLYLTKTFLFHVDHGNPVTQSVVLDQRWQYYLEARGKCRGPAPMQPDCITAQTPLHMVCLDLKCSVGEQSFAKTFLVNVQTTGTIRARFTQSLPQLLTLLL